MKHCAFLSMENLNAFECYDNLLFEPLAAYGWQVKEIPWRSNSVNWNQFEAVVIRSPWDYQDDPDHFLKVIKAIDQSSAHLENSLKLVQWNLDKRYLKDMQAQKIPIVPTLWKNRLGSDNLSLFFRDLNANELIIKPVISANADHTYRIDKKTYTQSQQKLSHIFAKRPLMVQPFMKNIIHEGEFSLFYFSGTYSHTVLKKPAPDDFRVQEEHGGTLKSIKPEPALKTIGQRTIKALPEIPLYARIDFVRTTENNFALMELELIEPSLYFNMDSESPRRFASAFNHRMKGLVK